MTHLLTKTCHFDNEASLRHEIREITFKYHNAKHTFNTVDTSSDPDLFDSLDGAVRGYEIVLASLIRMKHLIDCKKEGYITEEYKEHLNKVEAIKLKMAEWLKQKENI